MSIEIIVMIRTKINSIQKINLHLHSTASDGAMSPRALVKRAKQIGLDLISITDHDTVDAYLEHDLSDPGIKVLPGLEISATHKGHDVHILAYSLDIHDAGLKKLTDFYHVGRHERAQKIVDKLTALGMPLELDEVLIFAGEQELIVRPHIAQAMVARGYCANKNEAFDKYIGNYRPAYVGKPEMSVPKVLEVIKQAGGKSVVAHPGKLYDDGYLDTFIEMGVDGIEVWHPDHSAADVQEFVQKAEKHGLLQTAGSDFHGDYDRHNLIDVVPVTEAILASAKELWEVYKCTLHRDLE